MPRSGGLRPRFSFSPHPARVVVTDLAKHTLLAIKKTGECGDFAVGQGLLEPGNACGSNGLREDNTLDANQDSLIHSSCDTCDVCRSEFLGMFVLSSLSTKAAMPSPRRRQGWQT